MQLAWWRRMLLRILRYFVSVDHAAFIMDGNRRYARQLGMNIEQGHHDGLTKLFEVIEVCHLLGVRVVTVYAFSLQNFRRSAEEIRHLISLAVNSVDEGGTIRDFALRDSCRIRFCGDLNLVSEELRQLLAEVEADTAHFERITLNICMCYGGRSDINSALKKSAICEREGHRGRDPADFYKHLAAGDAPPPQVLIRTSGVTRLSDFLIYQCSEYTTFYFYKETWPNICMWSVVGAFIHKTLFDSYNRSTRSFTFFPAES